MADKKKKDDVVTVPDTVISAPYNAGDDTDLQPATVSWGTPDMYSGNSNDYAGIPTSAQPGPAPQLDSGQPQFQLNAPPSSGQAAANPQAQPYTAVPAGAQLGAAPQLQQPATIAPPTAQLPTPYGPGIAANAIGATPSQYQQSSLNLNQRQQDLALANADAIRDATAKTVAIQQQAANEKQQQASDFQSHLQTSMQQHNERERTAQQAYQNWVNQSKNIGQDPNKAFWADKSTGSKILSAFALFASGLGAGLQHKGGNPFLDFLNQQIGRNFDAHKEAIGEMYKQQVEAGRMEDTTDNYNKFMANAKITGYGLSADHITSQLEAIKAQTNGQAQANLADQTILGLQQNADNAKLNYSQQQARASATVLANQRQQIKDARKDYSDTYDKLLGAGYGADQAAQLAADSMTQKGYDRPTVTGIMSGNGYTFDSNTDKWTAPPKPVGTTMPGGDLIPNEDSATGKLLKPEEKEKLQELVVNTPEGQRLANSAEDKVWIQKTQEANAAMQNYNDVIASMQKANPSKWFDTTDGSERAKLADAAKRANAAVEAVKEENKSTGGGGRGIVGIAAKNLIGLNDDPFPDMSGALHPTAATFAQIAADAREAIAANKAEMSKRVRPHAAQAGANPAKPVSGKDLP
jgi:hypothetical protein